MKKTLLPFFTSLTLFAVSANAQMGNSHTTNVLTQPFQKQQTPVQPASATFTKNEQDNSTDRLITNPSAQFSNDITIETDTFDMRNAKVAVAFNGWIFSAFTLSSPGYGGIEVRKSTDGGFTWTTMVKEGLANVDFPALDIVVAGTDTANLSIFLAGVIHNYTFNVYNAWVDRFNAITGAYINETFYETNGASKIYDIAIAADYEHPSIVSSPFSIGLVYSKNAPLDSVIYASSIDGGYSYSRQMVYTTNRFCGKVAIAYGYSSNFSNGRYFVAFENRIYSVDNTGNILFSHTITDPTSSFQTPIYVDSINASCAGRMGHPRIACSNSVIDNDSGNISTIIMADRNFGGGDYDVVAEYSVYSVHSVLSEWHNIFVASSTSYETGADAAFNDSLKCFDITYYDSITHQLFAKSHDMNLGVNPALFTLHNGQYNDLTTNLIQPFPRVAVNPVTGVPCYAWNSEGSTNNGIPLFDAENNITGIPTAASAYNFSAPYPNPANDIVNFNYTLDVAQTVQLSIINLLGQEMISPVDPQMQAKGEYHFPIDLSNLPNGVYVYRFVAGTQIKTGNLVITH